MAPAPKRPLWASQRYSGPSGQCRWSIGFLAGILATDKVRAVIHDIRQLCGLDVPIPKEPPLSSTPDKPLHVSAVPGRIDWDAIPEDLAEEFLAVNAKILALQPASDGLIIDGNGASVE